MKYNINLLRDKLLPASLSFITILLLSRYTVFSSTLKWGTWSYGENLISYPEKFLRRGLLGELILLISGENSAFKTIQVMVFLNCLLLLFLIYKLFKTLSAKYVSIQLIFTVFFRPVVYDLLR